MPWVFFQYLTEDPSPVGIFYGLKYPPLDMLIEKQILRPGENVLSVSARVNTEFKECNVLSYMSFSSLYVCINMLKFRLRYLYIAMELGNIQK